MPLTRSTSRRSFLKQTIAGAFAAPAFIRNLRAASPNNVVRHASFGAGGMAAADFGQIITHPDVKLVCVADVDIGRAEALKARFPELRVYQDWRRLLDEESKNLDSVNVSTPDHMHASIGMSALQRGLHVYGQKPLTHDVAESRKLAEFATQKKLVTQMGIQIHSDVTYRSAVQLIQGGTIGKVKSVHSWSEKRWGDGESRPDRTDPIPADLNWDQWLGVCEARPFLGNGYYHPGNWRKRLDFGTGTFGDMGCHIFDPVFKALELTAPTTLRSTGPAPNAFNWANDAVVHLTFPETKHTIGPSIPITWYDGVERPSNEVTRPLLGDRPLPSQGSLFMGEKGALLLPHVSMPVLLPEAQFAGFVYPTLDPVNHWHQFVDAVKGNGTTSAHFGYSGPLTESVLLGGLATFFPNETLEWNAAQLKFSNKPAADHLVRRPYRKGWDVPGLSSV
ncbi:Gfo/Idh/MocA family protein [Schlesneria paludicola]|uniref:Gfo/Idh/MocA family protein n=1 Tax=Schlesneria paludicola TaxID=360056 RepID=UPI0002F8DC3A|nr:Gfo/Idh/MocA family oxidoreductase [Schlesneria paludicola]